MFKTETRTLNPLQISVAVLLSLTAANIAIAEKDHILRYKGEIGNEQRISGWFRMRMMLIPPRPDDQELNRLPPRLQITLSNPIKIEIDSQNTYSQTVIGKDKNGVLELESARVSSKIQQRINDKIVPTDNTTDDPYRRSVKMTSRGKVVKEQILDGDDNKINPDQLFGPGGPPILMEKLITKAVHNIVFPEETVATGHEWSKQWDEEIVTGSIVPITIKSAIKEWVNLEGHQCAVIFTLITAPIDITQNINGTSITMKGHMFAEATLHFDHEGGIDVLSEEKIRFVTSLNPEGKETATYRIVAHLKSVLLDSP